MKLGFGFYHHMLDQDSYRFARQCGATHAVVHLVDYFHGGAGHTDSESQPIGDSSGWGTAGATAHLWTCENFLRIREEMAREGLVLEAIENFDPLHWHDVLLAGPKRDAQIEHLQAIVRDAGRAGIRTIGYNFSLAGVASRVSGPFARGGALSVGMDAVDETPIPSGMVWNMVYDIRAKGGEMPPTTQDQLWQRLEYFLKRMIPVAEEAGVRLALHPDDPPAPYVRRQPRLVYQHRLYQRALDLVPSWHNALEFCLGTLMEMPEGDIYETIEHYAAQDRIAYIHFRNVTGKVPRYREVFIDEGDLDMRRVVRILEKTGYEGVLIPDHTPQMTCGAPWHAGMAYALGYMKGLLR
ncbi:MAG: D-mannonate dehydratase [Spirochaetaceae bacterium]|nr:MAG: D-mannonate dehydratase [Spirochaetaceae bacterium]